MTKKLFILFCCLIEFLLSYQVQDIGDFQMSSLPSDACNWSVTPSCSQKSLSSALLQANQVKTITVYGTFIPLPDSDTSTLFQLYDTSITNLRLEIKIQPQQYTIIFKTLNDIDNYLVLQSIQYGASNYQYKDGQIFEFMVSLNYQDLNSYSEGYINVFIKVGEFDFFKTVSFPLPGSKIFSPTSIIQVCSQVLYGQLKKLRVAYNYDFALKIDVNLNKDDLYLRWLSLKSQSLLTPSAPIIYKMDYQNNLYQFQFTDISGNRIGKFTINQNIEIPIQKLSSVQLIFESGFFIPLTSSDIQSKPYEFGITMNIRKVDLTKVDPSLMLKVYFNEGELEEVPFKLPPFSSISSQINDELDTFMIGIFVRIDFDLDTVEIVAFNEYDKARTHFRISDQNFVDYYYYNYRQLTLKKLEILKQNLGGSSFTTSTVLLQNPLELLEVRIYKNIFGFESSIDSQEQKVLNCDITTGMASKICLRCSRGFYLQDNGSCLDKCQEGYYILGRDCVKVCADGVNGNKCIIPSSCAYLANTFNPPCSNLDDSLCITPYLDSCFQCVNSKIQYQSRCLEPAAANLMNIRIHNNKIAVDMPVGFIEPLTPTCAIGYFLEEGECVLQCSPIYGIYSYEPGNSVQICIKCPNMIYYDQKSICLDLTVPTPTNYFTYKNCILFNPMDQTKCILCSDGWMLIANECIENKMVDQCANYDNNRKCIKCNNGYFLQQINSSYPLKCVKWCSPSYYFDYAELKCFNSVEKIEKESCEKREGFRCLKCASGYKLSCGQCIECLTTNCLTTPNLPVNGHIDNDTTKLCRSDYVLNSTLCEQNCPNGNYPDMNNNNLCSPCTNNQCLTCNSDNSCITYQPTSCIPGTYQNSSGCSPCSSECKLCTGPNGNCSECQDGFVLQGQKCIFQTSCPSGKYMDITFNCIPCTSPCQTCQYEKTLCLSCSGSNTLQIKNQCGSCSLDCQSQNSTCDTFATGSNIECESCNSNLIVDSNGECSTQCLRKFNITDLVNNQCVISCPSLTFFDGSNSQQLKCVGSCPAGFVEDPANNMCCANTCKTCESMKSTTCLSCDTGLFFLNDTCQISCPEGYREDSINNICQKCTDTNCLQCASDINICTQCNSSTFLQGESCQNPCSSSYYPDSNNICQNCMSDCQQCTSDSQCDECISNYFFNGTSCEFCPKDNCSLCSSLTDCQTCNSNFQRLSIGGFWSCFPLCSSNQYRNQNNGACENCMPDCNICSDISTCTTCAGGFQYVLKNGINVCDLECLSKQYRDSTGNCQNCIQDCQACSNGTKCNTCLGGFELYNSNTQCVVQCASNQFRDTNGICENCVDKCNSCSNNTSCSSCQSGNQYVQQVNVCKLICTSSQFRDPANNYECTQCTDHCDSCTSLQNCSACSSGYEYVNQIQQCKQICLIGQYREQVSPFDCVPCIFKCDSCVDGVSCNQCSNGFDYISYSSPKECKEKCLPANYRDQSSLLCTPCVTDCVSCQNGTSCDVCQGVLEFVPFLNKCDTVCVPDTFRDATDGICKPCPLQDCQTCKSYTECDVCVQYFSLDSSNQCIRTSCPDGKFVDISAGSTCQNCGVGCKKCLNLQQCLSCFRSDIPTQNYYLTPSTPYRVLLRSLAANPHPQTIGVCVNECDLDSRPDSSNNICCNPKCFSCSGFQENQCLSCPPKFALQPDTNTCQISCNIGEYILPASSPGSQEGGRLLAIYDSQLDTCAKCLPECETCENGDSCLTCVNGFYFENGKCVQKCTTGLYRLDLVLGKICCSLACGSCFNSLDTGCISCHNEVYSINSISNKCEYDSIKAEKLLFNLSLNSTKTIPPEYCHWSCKKCTSFDYDHCQECVSLDRILYRGTCSCPPGYEDIGSECTKTEKQGNIAFLTLNYFVLISFFGFILAGKYPLFSINTLFVSQFAGYFLYFQEPANVENKDYIYKAFNIDNLTSFFPNPLASYFLTKIDARYDQEYIQIDDQMPNDFRYVLSDKSQNFLYNVLPLLLLYALFGLLFLIGRFIKDPSQQSQTKLSVFGGKIIQSLRLSMQWNAFLLLMIFSYQDIITFIGLQFQHISTSSTINILGMIFCFIGIAYAVYVPCIIYYGINYANFDKHTKYGVLQANCIEDTSFTGKNQILIMICFKIVYTIIFVSSVKDKGSAILFVLLIYGIYRILEIVLNYRKTKRSRLFLLINILITVLIFVLAAYAYSLSKYRDANLAKFYDYDFAQGQIRTILVFIFAMKVLIMIAEMISLIFFQKYIESIYSKEVTSSEEISYKENKNSSIEKQKQINRSMFKVKTPLLPHQAAGAVNNHGKQGNNPNSQDSSNDQIHGENNFLQIPSGSTYIQNSFEMSQSPQPLLTDIQSTSQM